MGLCLALAPAGAAAQGSAEDEIPAGCPPRPEAVAVFVGEVRQRDIRAARFVVVDVRSGSLEGYRVDDLVDVDFFGDVRFLDDGQVYLVGAGVDPVTGRLVSKVRAPEPRFGGNQVVALDQLECPVFEDPAITLHLDGSTVESGVLTPLFDRPERLLLSLVTPAVWAFGVLAALSALKIVGITLVRRLAGAGR